MGAGEWNETWMEGGDGSWAQEMESTQPGERPESSAGQSLAGSTAKWLKNCPEKHIWS